MVSKLICDQINKTILEQVFFFVCLFFRLLSLWQGRDIDDLSPSGVPEEVRLTCTQFVRYHKDQCVQDIVHTRRYEYLFTCICVVFSLRTFVCVT